MPGRAAGRNPVEAVLYITTACLLSSLRPSDAYRLTVWADSPAVEKKDSSSLEGHSYTVPLPLKQVQVNCMLEKDDNPFETGEDISFSLEKLSNQPNSQPESLVEGFSLGATISSTVTISDAQPLVEVQCVAKEGTFGVDWKTLSVKAQSGLTAWSQWSSCDVTCGQGGQRVRTRTCFNPFHEDEKTVCSDTFRRQSVSCAGQPCQKPPKAPQKPRPQKVRTSLAQATEGHNLRIIVACSSGLIGSLLLSAVLACWRRLHLEQMEQQRQLLQPEATEPRYHGLNDQQVMRAAPPPSYHETFHIDVTRLEELPAGSRPSSSISRQRGREGSNGNNSSSSQSASPPQNGTLDATATQLPGETAETSVSSGEFSESNAENADARSTCSATSAVSVSRSRSSTRGSAASVTCSVEIDDNADGSTCSVRQCDTNSLGNTSPDSTVVEQRDSGSASPVASPRVSITSSLAPSDLGTVREEASAVSPQRSPRESVLSADGSTTGSILTTATPGASATITATSSTVTAASSSITAASSTTTATTTTTMMNSTPAVTSSTAVAADEQIDLLQRTTITYEYVVDRLRTGLTEDEVPLDDEEQESWLNSSDGIGLLL